MYKFSFCSLYNFRFLVVPIAINLGVPDKKKQNVSPNKQLEAAYLQHKTLQHTLLKVTIEMLQCLYTVNPFPNSPSFYVSAAQVF